LRRINGFILQDNALKIRSVVARRFDAPLFQMQRDEFRR
jgi:hypothetical protein